MIDSPAVRRINVFSIKPLKSKYFTLLEIYYKFLHICFCLDFGFFEYKSNNRRYFWKSITVIQFLIVYGILVELMLTPHLIFHIWIHLHFLIYYFLTVLILVLINPNKTFSKFFSDLESIDLMLRTVISSYNLEIFLISFCNYGFKFLVSFIYWAWLDKFSSSVILSTFYESCLQSVLISYSFVFYSMNLRLKALGLILKSDDSDINSLKYIYKTIVELTEKHKTTFDPLFALGLLFMIPQIMCVLYISVELIIKRYISDWTIILHLQYLVAAESLIILLLPAVIASMLATQTDNIKVILHDRLLKTYDVSLIQDIERFIRFVEARNCRFRVWKVIPLDADLLGMVLRFTATYLIIMIQFTM